MKETKTEKQKPDFAKVDATLPSELATKHNVKQFPTIIFIKAIIMLVNQIILNYKNSRSKTLCCWLLEADSVLLRTQIRPEHDATLSRMTNRKLLMADQTLTAFTVGLKGNVETRRPCLQLWKILIVLSTRPGQLNIFTWADQRPENRDKIFLFIFLSLVRPEQ